MVGCRSCTYPRFHLFMCRGQCSIIVTAGTISAKAVLRPMRRRWTSTIPNAEICPSQSPSGGSPSREAGNPRGRGEPWEEGENSRFDFLGVGAFRGWRVTRSSFRRDGDVDRCSRFHSEGSRSALCCLSRRCGSRYGLRGVSVGEAFLPGPRRRRVIPSTDHYADSTFLGEFEQDLSARPQNITQYRPHIAVRANCPTLQPTRRSVML